MYRPFAAFAVAVSFVCLLTLGLSAQTDLPPTPREGQFTLPPFDPPLGTVITVTTTIDDLEDNGNCTLREAIQAANTDAAVDGCPAGDGEDLVLVPAGIYTLTLVGPSEDGNLTGDLDIHSSMVISGAGAEETVIDANQIDRVVDVHTNAALGIYGLTLRNGHAPDGTREGCGDAGQDPCDGEAGGGMRNTGTVAITESAVISNAGGDGFFKSYPPVYSNGGEGGGIANYGSVLIIRSEIVGNRSGSEDESNGLEFGGAGGDGGGVVNLGIMEIISSHVLSNASGEGGWENTGGDGGGIWNTGVFSMTNSIVAFNETGRDGGCFKCWTGHSGDGGGIANQGIFSITSSIIYMNTTSKESRGAGLYNNGQAWVSASRVDSNRILEATFPSDLIGIGGGGIYNDKTLIVSESSINDNCVEFQRGGGGVFNNGVLSIINSTISGNRSGWGFLTAPAGNGGGILNRSVLFLIGSTVSDNTTRMFWREQSGTPCEKTDSDYYSPATGGSGGGVATDGGVTSMYNSIIADNHVVADGEGPDCLGTIVSYGHNLVGNMGSCSSTGLVHFDIYGRVAWLAPLADNGGPTPTHALLPRSPALNNGSCTTIDGTPITEDQRGEPRPQGQGCDIGAYESDLEYVPPEEIFLPVIGKNGE